MCDYIRLHNVTVCLRGRVVLKEINLALKQQEFVAVIGPNGSGKTSLGKTILGIFKPTVGEVLIDDTNIDQLSLSDVGKRIGYLFQNPNRQIFAPTVYEELVFGLKYRHLSSAEIELQVADIIKDLGLEHLKARQTYDLSQGEKQRVALAAIILNNPHYLVLDEPTTGLDKLNKLNLSLVLDKIKSKKIGVLMISHDMDFVSKHSDRIIELRNGSVVNDAYV